MKASHVLIEAVKGFEGFSPVAYKCPAGKWTVGYGHTAGVRRGDRMTEEEARAALLRDLRPVEAAIDALGVTQWQWRFDALCDFAFNLGVEALRRSTLLKKIRACAPDEEIRAEFRRWVWATVGGRKRRLPGLAERREWEIRRFFNEGA